MKSNGFIIADKLEQVVKADPWYGPSVMKVLSQIDSSSVSIRKGEAHTIAEILLHMIAWTEEVTARLQGSEAREPSRGDWPDPTGKSWSDLVGMFENANESLKQKIKLLPDEKWNEMVNDFRDPASGTGVSFIETVEGLIQHHVYHAGQIAILHKQIKPI
jgi:uncharacterized damage-inducible protein DinB